ncbi:MAG: DUF1080 domain-containing protein [Thermoguttaceae bacterium]|nr:DUF1080 domain-containing protein [Thermoguttaceae bacterium]MDW8039059.1 DUF1080 domain-containing protein [Thermoguttaceae bacterium]
MFRRFYVGRLALAVWGGLVVVSCVQGGESSSEVNRLTPEEVAEGWLLLWDGQTLFGWRAEPEGAWQVADDLPQANLQANPSQSAKAAKPPGGQLARLISTSQWADFILRLDFRVDPGSQASVVLRTDAQPVAEGEAKKSEYELKSGYELILAEALAAWPVGSLKDRKKAEGRPLTSDWHSMQVRLEAGTIAVWLDGQQVLEYEDPKPIRRGHVVLQAQTGRVAFRNIKLRPLGLRRIFNGRDLTGWKQYPQTPTKCTVTPEGYLRVQGGRGQLESEDQYGDFILQLEVFVNGQGLNSGVFFRCIPGESMNGYECQIHNGFVDGDRNKPKDCGTGGIFRRQNARRVVADDFQWFTLTIHVHGAHVATWVNGYQTADWTDTRPADPNPRKGRRLEPGTLQIQGHDPTTDLMFRNIRIGKLPER